MTVSLVQSNAVASTTSAPATIAATLTSPSTQGNFLVMVLGISSTGGTVGATTPTGWILVGSQGAGGTFGLFLYIMPNNPGGIQAIGGGIALSGDTTGGAVVSMFEFSGTLGFSSAESIQSSSGSNANPAQLTLTGNPSFLNELTLYSVIHGAAQTLTVVNLSPLFSGDTATASSSGATPNVTLHNFWGNTLINAQPTMLGAQTLSAAATWRNMLSRFAGGGGDITNDNVSGNAGILTGTFMQGMIGG